MAGDACRPETSERSGWRRCSTHRRSLKVGAQWKVVSNEWKPEALRNVPHRLAASFLVIHMGDLRSSRPSRCFVAFFLEPRSTSKLRILSKALVQIEIVQLYTL